MIDDPEAVLRSAQSTQALDTALACLGWFVAEMNLQRLPDRRSDVRIQLPVVPMSVAGEFDHKRHMAIVWPQIRLVKQVNSDIVTREEIR